MLGDLQEDAENSNLPELDWHLVVGKGTRQKEASHFSVRQVAMDLLQARSPFVALPKDCFGQSVVMRLVCVNVSHTCNGGNQ